MEAMVVSLLVEGADLRLVRQHRAQALMEIMEAMAQLVVLVQRVVLVAQLSLAVEPVVLVLKIPMDQIIIRPEVFQVVAVVLQTMKMLQPEQTELVD
jgi:hypothetical protein